MKLAIRSVLVLAMFGLIIADALFTSDIQDKIMNSCTTRIDYDKSGDMVCAYLAEHQLLKARK